MLIGGEFAALHIRYIFLEGVRLDLRHGSIFLDELRGEGLEHAEHVAADQQLPIAGSTCSYAVHGDGEVLRYEGRELWRHSLKQYRKSPGLLDRSGVEYEFPRALRVSALRFEAPERPGALGGEAECPDQDPGVGYGLYLA